MSVVDTRENCFVEKEDWRQHYTDYLLYNQLLKDVSTFVLIKQKAAIYFMKDGQLCRKSFQGKALRCLVPNEIEEVMSEIHSGDCRSHLGGRRLFEQLISMGYFWPSMKSDVMEFVKICEASQRLGNLTPSVEMGSVTSP